MIILSAKEIKKSYGTDTIINGASFAIHEKDKIGLIGVNGAGKSTLLKIITNKIEKDSGEIHIDRKVKIAYMSQFLNFNSESTLWDEVSTVFSHIMQMEKKLNIIENKMSTIDPFKDKSTLDSLMKNYANLQHNFENEKGFYYKSKIKGVLTGLGFSDKDYNKKVSTFSGGQKTRIALAKILLKKKDLLLLDEPTNYLDIESVEWLERFLKDYNGSLMIISHDRYLLDSVCNKIFEIEDGVLNTYEGNYTIYLAKKAKEIEQQQKNYENQQKEIERQEAIIAKFKQYNREKSIKQAESRQKMLMRIDRIEKPNLHPKKTSFTFTPSRRSGNDVLQIDDLSKSYDSLLFKNFSLEIKRGEKVALLGPNGIGKTTLLKIIVGHTKQDKGTIKLGASVFPSYFDQEQEDLNEKKMIIDEIWDEYPRLNQTAIRNALATFLFRGEDVFKEISVLSGGEKSRLSLLKLMLSKANLLLLDEPTNHLDMQSREVLESALLSYSGTILFISHDRYFLNKVATKVVELGKNSSTVYNGGYSYYIDKRDSIINKKEVENSSSGKEQWIQQKENEAKERYRLKRIENIEMEIEEIEKQKKENNKLLEKPHIFSDHEKCHKLYSENEALEMKLYMLYEEWDTLI